MPNDKTSPLEKEIIISCSSLIFLGFSFLFIFLRKWPLWMKTNQQLRREIQTNKIPTSIFFKTIRMAIGKKYQSRDQPSHKMLPPSWVRLPKCIRPDWSTRLAVPSEWVHCHQISLDYSLVWEFNRLLPNPSSYSMDSIFRRSLGDLSYREPEYLIQMSLIPTRQVRRIN